MNDDPKWLRVFHDLNESQRRWLAGAMAIEEDGSRRRGWKYHLQQLTNDNTGSSLCGLPNDQSETGVLGQSFGLHTKEVQLRHDTRIGGGRSIGIVNSEKTLVKNSIHRTFVFGIYVLPRPYGGPGS